MAIIKVENLSKKYIIGHDRKSSGAYNYSSLRDSIAHSCRGVYQRLRHPMSPNRENTDLEEFWALKDINFEINAGDKVGIIGRNGAGKSTLLKILSRITEPTTGKITMNGRVASLLEVGTGFHPELTGRENIYLNGSILGMARSEITKKFDEIVDFSGVEKFLDTPVKRYSSGMYVRLAFAVAAQLEPEILLIDEVLAVGDAEFQKKCLGKIDEVSKQGRTILFVSHNMDAIRNLCTRTIFLENGKLITSGDTRTVISDYITKMLGKQIVYTNNMPSSTSKKLIIRKAFLDKGNKKNQIIIKNSEAATLNIDIEIITKGKGYNIGFDLYSVEFGCLFCSTLDDDNVKNYGLREWLIGRYSISMDFPINFLKGGDYFLNIGACIPKREWLDKADGALFFTVEDCISPISIASEPRDGVIIPMLKWSLSKSS